MGPSGLFLSFIYMESVTPSSPAHQPMWNKTSQLLPGKHFERTRKKPNRYFYNVCGAQKQGSQQALVVRSGSVFVCFVTLISA